MASKLIGSYTLSNGYVVEIHRDRIGIIGYLFDPVTEVASSSGFMINSRQDRDKTLIVEALIREYAREGQQFDPENWKDKPYIVKEDFPIPLGPKYEPVEEEEETTDSEPTEEEAVEEEEATEQE